MPSVTKHIEDPKGFDYSLSPQTVREHFYLNDYNEIIRRGEQKKNGKYSDDKPTGSYCKKRDRVILTFKKRRFLGEHIAWCLYHGRWPEHPIRPKDLNFKDLDISNWVECPDGSITVSWD